jgi:nitrile hydratase subunit beta
MDGVHDMGGMDGFGRVEPEPDEPVFHEAWEGRVLAMNRAMSATGSWSIDMARFSREQLPPLTYLAASYYQRWFLGMQQMLLDRGLVGADEVAAGRALRPGAPLPGGPFTASDVPRVLTRGAFGRRAPGPARFSIGDRVRARNLHPPTHTRLPRYARGHAGVVERIHGCHVLPDTALEHHSVEPLRSRELWGPDADPAIRISIDAFEPYLEPA